MLNPEIESNFPDPKIRFQQIMSLKGTIYRQLENRCTMRLCLKDRYYFIKKHTGVGWFEIIKNLLQLRLPVISAKHEYLALKKLKEIGIPTQEVVGFGCEGANPAKKKSFLITKELPQLISLEEWVAAGHHIKQKKLKRKLLLQVAEIAHRLHSNGINHRDFYICHFLLDLIEYPRLYLIDLHRAQIRQKTPLRWSIKDLAGLYFSSKEAGLTERDRLRFIQAYRKKPLREIMEKEHLFWKKVKKRGDKLFERENGRNQPH